MNKNELNDTERSEEVQEIIDRMPTKDATYVAILTSIGNSDGMSNCFKK